MNYVVSGKTQSLINVDISRDGKLEPNVTLVVGTDRKGWFDHYNKYAYETLSGGDVIYPLFDIRDVALKSKVYKATIDGERGKSDNFIDIYAPQMKKNPLGFSQNGDYAYGLADSDTEQPNVKGTNLEERREDLKSNEEVNDYSYREMVDSGRSIGTYLYRTLTDLSEETGMQLSSYGQYLELNPSISSELAQELFVPVRNADGIVYNCLYEVPLNSDTYNDYDSGDIQGDVFLGKNTYDSTYSIDIRDGMRFSGCREYCGIGTCGGLTYLKYYDNIGYTPGISSDGEPTSVHMVKTIGKRTYQKVEVIQSINRFNTQNVHRSNFYSVRINQMGIDSTNFSGGDMYSEKNVRMREMLKQDIRNKIRELTESICPVNTHLFDVEVN